MHGNLLPAIWTLPIEIFLSHLDSRQLDTSLMTSYGHFWHMSTFGDSRAIWVLLPKYGALRKSKFSQWRSNQWSTRLGGFRWADNWTTWWYHFLGGVTHLRSGSGRHPKKRHFSGHLRWQRVLRIDPFDQESVHRCSLGCSTYLDPDFWIRDRLAVCWAVKWQFLRCQKVADFFWPPKFRNFEP